MNRISKMVAVTILVTNLAVGVAAADSSISNTGPGSSNTITSDNSSETNINCNNNITSTNNNPQTSGTGSSSSTGNTTGGNSTSGSSSNSSSSSTSVDANCGAAKSPVIPTVVTKAPVVAVTPAPTVAPVTTPQVVVPVGGVHAGGGAGSRVTSVASVVGILTSAGATVTGIALKRRSLAL